MTTKDDTALDWVALAGPNVRRASVPLRVAVYAALARAIRSGALALGSLLPFEADLCEVFGVSRTVMREALILLEEDGLIRTRRGVGRFVVDHLPEIGLERLQPIETLLRDGDAPSEVRSLRREQERTTDFTSRGLGLGEDAVTWFWESLIFQNGEPVALSQEWIPSGPRLRQISPQLAAAIGAAPRDGSLLARVNEIVGRTLGPGSCDVSVSAAGTERGAMFGASRKTPILVLSHSVMLGGHPLYLGKHMIRAEAGHIHVIQSAQS